MPVRGTHARATVMTAHDLGNLTGLYSIPQGAKHAASGLEHSGHMHALVGSLEAVLLNACSALTDIFYSGSRCRDTYRRGFVATLLGFGRKGHHNSPKNLLVTQGSVLGRQCSCFYHLYACGSAPMIATAGSGPRGTSSWPSLVQYLTGMPQANCTAESE